MAAVPVTIVGILTTDQGSTNATMVGMASLTGLGVGGGPIMPPSDAHPEHPIVLPPGRPIDPGAHPEHPIVIPPTIWPDPPEGTAPHPEHPIVIPPPPDIPNAPPLQAKIVWVPPGYPNSGWNVIYVPTGEHPAPG